MTNQINVVPHLRIFRSPAILAAFALFVAGCGGTGGGSSATATAVAVPTVTINGTSVVESDTAVTVMVSLSAASDVTVSVSYSTEADTATAGEDFVAISGTLVFSPGSTSLPIEVPITDDGVGEPDEQFRIKLVEVENGTLSSDLAIVTIQDNDGTPSNPNPTPNPGTTPQEPVLMVSDAQASEGSGTVEFGYTLSFASSDASTFRYDTQSNSATAGSDFAATSGTITINAGVTFGRISVNLIDDSTIESTEEFSLNLSAPVGLQLASNSAIATIEDDDSAAQANLPEVSIADASASEASGSISFNVTLSTSSSSAVTLSYSTADGSANAGQDYVASNGTVTFEPGSTSKTLLVDLIDDQINEADEVFDLVLSSPSGAAISRSSAQGIISDNDSAPSISIGDVSTGEAAGSARLSLTLSQASVSSIRVSYATVAGSATPGSDFTARSGDLYFSPGSVLRYLDIPIANDSVDESDESFSVQLSNPVNATLASASAAVTIVDNDSATGSIELSIADLVVTEGDSGNTNASIIVSLNSPSTSAVTASYAASAGTASAGSDYNLSAGSITIPAGQLSASIAVAIVGNTTVESSESFTVTLSSPSGATIADGTATITIVDDDTSAPPPTPTLSIQNGSITEGDSGSSTLQIAVTLSSAATNNVSASYATSNGTATAGSDYTASQGTVNIPAGQTSSTISIAVLGDTVDENNESFSIALSNASGATIADGFASASILDNDDAPSVLGLSNRPSNTTCLAPSRTTTTTGGGGYALTSAFPNLPAFSNPVALRQPKNDSSKWYVLERYGYIRVFDNNSSVSSSQLYLDITSKVDFGGEGGLLGLAFHPSWPAVKEFYAYYTTRENGPTQSRVSRFVVSSDASLPATVTEQILLTVDQITLLHNGGDIHFGPDNNLYIGLGDGGGLSQDNNASQENNKFLGSMLRIDVLGAAYPTPGYNIPAGNPFAANAKCSSGTNANDCPEVYAWGFRNPWRWSFDRNNGDLWLADVGQAFWEEVNKVQVGGNYGWRCREGANDWLPGGCNATYIDPIYEHDHSDGNISITGGYVYRGSKIPALAGRYIFSDFNSGRIWSLPNGGGASTVLIDSSYAVSTFAEANNGDLYVVDYAGGRFYELTSGGGGTTTVTDPVPASLVDTGCVNPTNPTQPATGMVPYQPAAPFWSDNAVKDRWVGLPNGSTITASTNGNWSFPVGTVLMKSFELNNALIETRLFMRHPDGEWVGYTYEWNASQTQALRIDSGKMRTIGSQTWIYPSQTECLTCHTSASGRVLGLETAQLNADFTYPSTGITDNQIEVFNHIGMFANDLAEPVSSLPNLVDPLDTSKSLSERARSYLHTNCAQCHQPGGATGAGMDLRYSTSLTGTGACNVAPQAGDLGIANASILAPGSASRSVLVARMNRRDSNAMPPLGSTVVDASGVALMSQWINGLVDCSQ